MLRINSGEKKIQDVYLLAFDAETVTGIKHQPTFEANIQGMKIGRRHEGLFEMTIECDGACSISIDALTVQSGDLPFAVVAAVVLEEDQRAYARYDVQVISSHTMP